MKRNNTRKRKVTTSPTPDSPRKDPRPTLPDPERFVALRGKGEGVAARCQARKRGGSQCRRAANKDADHCATHNPGKGVPVESPEGRDPKVGGRPPPTACSPARRPAGCGGWWPRPRPEGRPTTPTSRCTSSRR